MKAEPIKEVKNNDLKNHLKRQDLTLGLLKKAVNQIVDLLQDNSVKVSHLFRWKERERLKTSRVSFKTANLAIRITSIIGYIMILAAMVYGGYKLFNWLI